MMAQQRGYTVSSTAGKFLEQNPGRRILVIQNLGAQTLRIGLGQAANTAAGIGIALAQNAIWNPAIPPGEEIWLQSAGADISVVLVEE